MKIMLDEGAIMPTRAHKHDAGLDLYSREDKIIWTKDFDGNNAVFDTGVHIELPPGTYGRLESKSGLNINFDIVCLGGTIDEGYTGSIRVKLYNLGKKPYMIRKGQKIIQLVIIPCEKPKLDLVDRLEDTERGEKGFGSSGL